MVLILITIICGIIICFALYQCYLTIYNGVHPMIMPERDGSTLISFSETTHLGGNPNIRLNGLVNFELNNKGILRIRANHEYTIIATKDIIKCEFKTEQQIKQSVSVGGLLMFGVFALGAKKQTKITNSYMIFDYKLNNVPIKCLFEAVNGQKLSQLVYKINEMTMNGTINLAN